MRNRYLIPNRYGLLEIDFNAPDGRRCRFVRRFPEEIPAPRVLSKTGQPYLPFPEFMTSARLTAPENQASPDKLAGICPEIPDADTYVNHAEQVVSRIYPLLLRMPGAREMLLELCLAGGRGAIELAEDNPALALLLALRISRDPRVCWREQVALLVLQNRTNLLAYCHYPSEKWIERLLRKIPVGDCTAGLIQALQKVLLAQDPEQMRLLRHLPLVTGLVLDILTDPRRAKMVAPRFYRSIAADLSADDELRVEYLLDEIIRISDESAGIRAPLLRHMDELPRVHDQVALQYARQAMTNADVLPFPDPPFPGGRIESGRQRGEIRPIRNGLELVAEGEKMKHCIATYAGRIARNENEFAYHARLGVEEATALLARSASGWRLAEINGIRNQKVSQAMLRAISTWLDRQNKRAAQCHPLMK